MEEKEEYRSTRDLMRESQSNPLFVFVGFTVLFVAGLGLFFYWLLAPSAPIEEEIQWGKPAAVEEQEVKTTISDRLLQPKVEATAASVKLFGGRMGSYDGACNDVTVVDPIKCVHADRTFMVWAPLSNGTYYCVDSNSFSGIVGKTSTGQCQ